MPTPIAPAEYPNLITTINITYQDQVEKILAAQVQDDGDTVIALGQDGIKRIAFKITSSTIEFRLVNPQDIKDGGPAEFAELGAEWSELIDALEYADRQRHQTEYADRQSPTINQYSEQLRHQAGPEIDGWVAQIQTMLTDAPGLAQFSESLLTLFPDLPGDKLRAIMTDATMAASLAGQHENA